MTCSTLALVLRPTRSRLAACVATSALLMAGGGASFAQSDGVHIDPESPAGKEYALPLESARENASPNLAGGGSSNPNGDSRGAGANPAPLFGAGISPRKAAAGGERPEQQDKEREGGEAMGGVEAGAVPAAVADNESGLSAGLLSALIGGGVLVVGGALGLSLRSLRKPNQAA